MNHYQPVQKAHTHHATTGNYSRYQTGKLVGEYRDIPAVIIDEAGFDGLGVQTQVGGADDAWCLVNVFDHLHRYVESVAINGAIDADHAVCVALGQFDHLETAYGKIVSAQDASFDQMHWSSTAIYRVLSDDRQNAHYLPIINHKQLYDAATRITGLSVQWDGINPVSHGNIGQLLLDMQKHDTYHEMVQTFDLAQALSDAQPMELDAFDALVESYNRLDLFKERLFRAMAKTPQDDIRVVNVTLTKPFKRQGVANIAMVFELSDGQHISIWFHNPDANPNKLGATDIMASWKWLLNRRDVTAALSPPNGANVQLPMLAHRMMRLAAKNSKRFIAAQKRKQVNQAKLAAAQSLVDERLAKLSEQDEEIERLSQQLASLTPTQAPQAIAKEVMVDVDAEVVGAASDDPDERLHAKPEQAVIHNPQQMAQKAVQDEYDEPVVNISSLTTPVQELDKDAYFDEYKEIIKNNKMVYCPPLKDEVELRSKAGKHILNRGDYTVKFPLLKHVPQMIKTAFDKKPMTVVGKRNIKEAYRVFTNVQIDGENKIAGMVVFKDNNNRFIYDMYINEKNRIGKGVTLPSGVASSDDDADNPAPVTPLGNDNTQIDSLSQEFFEDDDAMLDSLKSGYVLNLFIFDEHGNEITDDEPTQSSQADASADEPVVLTGDEFGEFDLTTEAGKKSLRNAAVSYLNSLADEGDTIYCADLQADVKFGRKNNRKFGSLSGSEVKLFMAGQIKNIIARAKKFKPSQDRYDTTKQKNKMTYHYLKTAVMYQDKEYGARIVIREDSNGNYHYDLQVNSGGAEAIFDGIDTEKAELLLATNQGLFGFDNDSSNFNNPSQEFFEDDDAMLDSLKSGYVLNLFIFDEHGNEITDDEPVGETYSSDNPHAEYANDDALIKQNADNWENRLPRLTGDKVAEYNAKANPLGYVGDNEPRHASVGLYNLEKWVDVGDRRYAVKIDGKFKNFTSDESWDKPTDFEVYAEIIENGESNAWRDADDEQYYKATNDFDEALAQAEHWLKMAKQLVLNQDEPTDEPVVLTGDEFGEFDISTNAGKKAYIEKVANYLDTLNQKHVYNASLQADIVIGRNAVDKSLYYNGLNKSPVKMQAMAKILEILKQAKVFKPSKESYDDAEKRNKMTYHYLKTPFFVDGTEYGARIVVRQDKGNDKYYYDFQVRDNINVIFDGMQKNSPEEFPLTHSGLVQGYESHVSANDAKSQDVFDKLNDLTSNMVLNLFIFDEHGNEITDDEPTQSSQADASADDKKVIAAQNKSRNSSIYDEVAKLIQMVDDENSNKNRYTAQIKDVVIINDIMGKEHDFSKFELLKNVTVGFVRALNAIMQIADSKGYHLIISDYNSTLNQDNLFDNIFGAGNALTFGVIAQLGKDGVVCRISIDDIGRITVLQGSNGDKAMFMLKYNAPNLADKLADGFAMGHSDHPVDASADDKKVIAAAELSQTKHDDANKQAKLPVQVIDVSAIDTDLSKYTGTSDEQAKAFFDEQLKGKVVKTQIGDVHLIGSTWKKIKQGLPKDKIKAKLVPFVPMILTQGKYEGKNALKKHPANQSYVAFHSFVKDGIKIDNSLMEVRVFVGERDDGVYEFVVYSLHHDKSNAKNKALDSLTVVNATGLSKACNDSVQDDADDVNSIPQDGTVFDGVMFDDIEDGTDGWNIEIISITPIQEVVMNPNYTQDDIDYLNSIVNGSTNPLEVDFDRLIAIGEKDDTDPLFEQANDVISQALDQATQGE